MNLHHSPSIASAFLSTPITEVLKDLDALVDTKTAAKILGLTNHRTLAVWRSTGRYPELRFLKIGRTVRYRVRDLLAFLEKCGRPRSRST